MTEPLKEKKKLSWEELFTKDAVEKFQKGAGEIEKKNLRHYNQLVTRFDDSTSRFALSKFQIPIKTRVTIYGGFTGQFAESLKRIGMDVVFTDPILEWVEQARKRGLESFQMTVQEFPKELVERTDLFATFECYPDLLGGESKFYYPAMRMLTVKYGILFAESKDTVESMREENPERSQELGTFRRWFRPIYRVYGIQRKSLKTEHLNFYSIFAGEKIRETLNVDCRVMKAVHDTFESEYKVTALDVSTIADITNLDSLSIGSSFDRLRKLSDSIYAPFLKSLPFLANEIKGSLNIGSKLFYFLA